MLRHVTVPDTPDPSGHGRTASPPVRPEVALSWRRSQVCGVDPALDLGQLAVHEVDPRAPLPAAARPVLDRMTDDLGAAGLTLLLADRDGLVCDVRPPWRRGPAADLAMSRVGQRCTEETAGTNSIGTVLELGRPMRIRGADHYAEALQEFDCLGVPIAHPVHGRVEGVLNLCGPPSELHPAFLPFLTHAARSIGEQLLVGTSPAHLELLGVFEAARRRHPSLVLLGPDLVLATPAASTVLEPPDHTMLRERACELGRDEVVSEDVELASGAPVGLTLRRCGIRGTGLLVEIRESGGARRSKVRRGPNVRPSIRDALTRDLDRARHERHRTLITGERGSGRTSAVRELAASAGTVLVECAATDGAEADVDAQLGSALAAGRAAGAGQEVLVVLDGIEAWTPRQALRALTLLGGCDAWVVLTGPPVEELPGEHAALVGCCSAHVHLPPLRARVAELPALVARMGASVGVPGTEVPPRWTAAALEVVEGHPWRGNLHELRAVVEQATRSARDGWVTVDALPPTVRRRDRRPRGPLQQAEREVIEAALRACDGNKVHAAHHLGISRTTLYKRMRALDLAQAR